ncbi:MAG: hypothetical protein RI953_1321 [Pseudomonadota bacterium]|jgi:hypothetical protein
MASPTALMLAFAPLFGDATPAALGLGQENLIQTEISCGSFCLNSANAHFDVAMNAGFSKAQLPQSKSKLDSSLNLSPISVTTYDFSWHPFYDFVVGAGYRTSSRSTERSLAGKTVKRVIANSRDIPVSIAARPAESFSFAVRGILRNIEVSQENPNTPGLKSGVYSASPHRWSMDALWQKNESTGYALTYLSPSRKTMTNTSVASTSSATALAPSWTDPQEFTFSMAHFSSFSPPDGVVFGPFENVFHASLTTVTWESGKPVAYAALASNSVGKDGWSLTDNTSQTQEFIFDQLDPSLSGSAGLESTWLRTSLGAISTYTHFRFNHIATRKNSSGWQSGFGLGFSNRYLSLQASTVWREEDAGYAFGISSSF